MTLSTTLESEMAGDQALRSSKSMLPEVVFTKGDQMRVTKCTFGGLQKHPSCFSQANLKTFKGQAPLQDL